MPTLESGTYVITTYLDGRPLGVPRITMPSMQPLLVDPGPAILFKAVVTRQGNGAYAIALGGYPFTGMVGNAVFVSLWPDRSTTWKIEWREAHGAYTISTLDGEKGWTIPVTDAEVQFMFDTLPGTPVGISPLFSTYSIPTQFLGRQLFNFEPYIGEVGVTWEYDLMV